MTSRYKISEISESIPNIAYYVISLSLHSQEDADIQWKFSRSKLWMSFFEGRGTVAVPFNCIPTPKTIYYILKWFRDWLRGEKTRIKKQVSNLEKKHTMETIINQRKESL